MMTKFRATAFLLTGLLAALALPPGVRTQRIPASEPVLVVPFENVSGDARLHWLSEASALLLTENLERLGASAITRDERLKAFERLGLPASAPLSQATIIRVGQLIGAAEVVVGRFTVAGGRLEFTVRIIRLDAGRMPSDIVDSAALGALYDVMGRLAPRLLPAASPRAAIAPKEPPLPVFEAYVRGLIAETPADQIRSLEAALALEPEYSAARIALWQVHTAQGDHPRALAAVSKVAAASPLSGKARFLSALSAISLQRYDAAFEQLTALSNQAPVPTVLNNLGVVQLRRGNTSPGGGATYYFTKAADLAPEDPDYAFNLGYAYWRQLDGEAAIYWLREAVRRNPADGHAHFVLGVALQARGSTVEGEREKDLARQLSSTYLDWQRRTDAGADPVPRGLERLRLDLDAPRLSLVDVTAAPAERKDQRELASFHADRGRRLFEQQKDREAIAELKRSLYLSPYQAEVHLLVGRIDLRAGRLREASESFRISLWCNETIDAHVALGQTLLLLEDALGAQTEANRALALDVNHAEARSLLERATRK